MKRTVWERIGDFVMGKGFYIVLFLCIATIGISGYYLFRGIRNEPTEPVTGNPTVILPDEDVLTPVLPRQTEPEPVIVSAQPSGQAAQAPESEEIQPTQEIEETEPPQAVEMETEVVVEHTPEPEDADMDGISTASVYTWPVKGDILSGFSLEVLAYDPTMGDWRTHSGVDIAAPEGTRVLSISDGTVQAVFHDDLMGSTVIVDHGDGMTSTYCNLAEEPVVTAGDEVETGTVLGSIGHTAIAESVRPAHLHLEMSVDGMVVDPVNYLPAAS